MDGQTEHDRGGLATTLRAALNAGLAAGAVLGLIDGVVAGSIVLVGGLTTTVACIAAATVTYGVVYALAAALLGIVAHPWLRSRTLGGRVGALTALALGLGLFLEVFWWTRPWVLYGVPATDPRRLGAAAAMLALSLAAAFGLVHLGAKLPRAWKWSGAAAVVLGWLIGAPYLMLSKEDVEQLGRLNDRNRDLPNVLFVVHDALRADVLGCYGNVRVKTPVMDSLAARGVLFENAFVQAPYTGSSFASFFTGKHLRRHGFVKMVPGLRMEPSITLASHLDDGRRLDGRRLEPSDFHSATFMTGALSHASGLMRGFDSYFEAMDGRALVDAANPWSRFRAELVLSVVACKFEQRLFGEPVRRVAQEWFRENGRKRFFAMAHFYSTHTPYDPPQELRALYCDPDYRGPVDAFYSHHREMIESGAATPTEADKQQIRNLYYAGVTHCDRMLGDLLKTLDERGVLDNTIVVVTADHGEELDDHGLWEHNHMFNTNLRVPLIVAAPGRLPSGVRVRELVQSIDLLPSLCELMGLEVPHEERPDDQGRNYGLVDGVSFVSLANGGGPIHDAAFAENGQEMAVQDLEWKLIVRAPDDLAKETLESIAEHDVYPAKLFHLAQDPGETRNVLEPHRDQAERLFAILQAWDATMPLPRHSITTSDRDREAEAHRLRLLGYAEGVGAGTKPKTPRGPRPATPREEEDLEEDEQRK